MSIAFYKQVDEQEEDEIKRKSVISLWTEILQSIPWTKEYKSYQKDNAKVIDDDNITVS